MDTDVKLARDRTPEIIEASGRQPTTRALGQAERLAVLLLKLQAESNELRIAGTFGEQRE